MAFNTDMLEIIESYKQGGYKEADITFKRVCEEMKLTLADVIMFRSKIASAIGVLESQITQLNCDPVSRGATHYLPTKDGGPAMFYRIEPVKYNDGSVVDVLQYLNHSGSWCFSCDRDIEGLTARLVPIEKDIPCQT